MKYKINGTIELGSKTQSFVREVIADSEALAEERLYSELGSTHGLKRTSIGIEKIKEI